MREMGSAAGALPNIQLQKNFESVVFLALKVPYIGALSHVIFENRDLYFLLFPESFFRVPSDMTCLMRLLGF